MRGFVQHAVRPEPTDLQTKARALSRHRRQKLAKAAQTTLVKIDQWGRGDAVPQELAGAIERAVVAAIERKSKKKA